MKNLNKIVYRLYDWRKARHLFLKGQMEGLFSNVNDEIGEYYNASNDFEKIDAICDTCIFCLNAMGEFAANRALVERDCESGWTADVHYKIKQADVLFKRAKELVERKDNLLTWRDDYKVAIALRNQFFDVIWEIVELCAFEIEKMGFSFKKTMNETLKEIESRTGHWDEEQKKFIKDNQGSYTADYSKCKRSAK